MGIFNSILQKLFHRVKDSAEKNEMTFFEHLEELRKQILKALLGVLVGIFISIYYLDFIVKEILLRPLLITNLKSQVLSPYGIVMLYMETALIGGIVLSMPFIIYCLWKFVAPGLLKKERLYISKIVFFTSFCFFAGIAFGYFILIPTALNFFASFHTDIIQLNISLDSYITFMLTMLVGAGLVFELPMVSYFLSKMGILTPEFMRKYRRHAIVIIFIIAAIVTPTPDLVTQSLLALPMILLYEISIFISKYVEKKHNANTEEQS